MLKLTAMAFLLASACVEAPEMASRPAVDPPIQLQRVYLTDDPGGDDDEECALTVAEDGPCANACDADWVASFVPDGACVAFECALLDGRTIRIGGCGG